MLGIKESVEHVCYECDAEFVVEPIGETDDIISFCPFCGSELDLEELDEEEDESEQEPIDKANLKIEEGRRAIDELLRQESQQIDATSAATSAAPVIEVNKGTKKPKENKSKKGGSKKVRRQSNKYSKRRR